MDRLLDRSAQVCHAALSGIGRWSRGDVDHEDYVDSLTRHFRRVREEVEMTVEAELCRT